MRTNVVLDDELIKEAARLTGIKTKRALIHEALRVLVSLKGRQSLLLLQGRVKFAPGYNHKALREQRG